jgi:hypothetical protein
VVGWARVPAAPSLDPSLPETELHWEQIGSQIMATTANLAVIIMVMLANGRGPTAPCFF